MCIIIDKPANAKMPTKETLKNCFINNDDGAGFMFQQHGRVRIVKGLMDFETFYKKLTKYKLDNKRVVFHFRISTSGGINTGATHPFPLTKDIKQFKQTNTTADVGIAHNGIIHLCEPTKQESQQGINDTMLFIKDFLTLMIDSKNKPNKNTIELIDRLTNSKLAIMYSTGDVIRTNEKLWYEHNGCYYSNTSYEYNYHWYDKYYCYGNKTTTTKTATTNEASKEDVKTPVEDNLILPDDCPLLYSGSNYGKCRNCTYYKYCYGVEPNKN